MKTAFYTLIVIALLLIAYFIFRIPIANHHRNAGIQYYDSAQYEQATNSFTKSVKWNRKNYESLVFLIKCQIVTEEIPLAYESFIILNKFYPDSAETFALNGQLKVIDEDYNTALPLLNEAIKTDSTLSYAYFYRAIAQANLGDLEAAAADYIKAQELDITNSDALQQGADVFSMLNNFKAAITNYDKLIALDSSNADAFIKRGSFKYKISDFEEALADFNEATKLAPENNVAFYERGKTLANLKQYREAINDFKHTISNSYKISGSNFNIGFASMKLNDNEAAKKYLKLCVKTDTDKQHSARALHYLGVLYIMQNKHDEAINYFNQSVALDSTSAEAYYNRGIANGILEQYRNAINDLNKCLELGKESSDIYFALGVYRISLRDNKGGCEDLSIAVKMGHEQAKIMQQKYCKHYLK